ncbi:MAG: carboxylating nicotinate-nucleotide diphosphorylase [Candidatus Melainabacteria bacterium]|nr:carboxylating nicotinate-nucleotide diphosphorylase [Candidatus Melainabacteria bacterium]
MNHLTAKLIESFLAEDLSHGDVTTDSLPLAWQQTRWQASIIARTACVVSGLGIAKGVFTQVDPTLQCVAFRSDADRVLADEALMQINGTAASILKAERTALNLLQHLCGIATSTQAFVQAIEGTGAIIAHTRKTTPGLRSLELQAVIDGGGRLHRTDLGQAAMLKDNHLALANGNVALAVQAVRQRLSHMAKLCVEADTFLQVQQALDAGADVILLDNMSPQQVRQAVALIDGRATVEVSGGITLHNVRAYAEAGAQVISTSQITLGAPSVDLGLDVETP